MVNALTSPIFSFSKQNIHVNDESITKNLMQLEELYGYKFGVVYQSNFNTLIVDPIKSSNSEAPKKFFPYERIVSPNGKNGVVMIPKYKNNFLLLNQYRHAPRKMQYSFPRGFSEDNSTSSENAARELKEEIGATIVNEPILLGNVISDSGLTGNRVDVYLVEIESFQQNQLVHEGIKQIIEIPVNKMDDWIRQGKIDDGFSLSAYALYQSHISYFSHSSTVGGLVPTRLMSPMSTFQNCGNSSRE